MHERILHSEGTTTWITSAIATTSTIITSSASTVRLPPPLSLLSPLLSLPPPPLPLLPPPLSLLPPPPSSPPLLPLPLPLHLLLSLPLRSIWQQFSLCKSNFPKPTPPWSFDKLANIIMSLLDSPSTNRYTHAKDTLGLGQHLYVYIIYMYVLLV